VTCALIANTTDPATVSQALSRPDAPHWKGSMESEYNSLRRRKTWTLVPRPAKRKVIRRRCVFEQKVSQNDTGTDALRYKSRLVANGYTQTYGMDYETFAPVVSFTSIRTLLALVAHLNLQLPQMDVVTAFLKSDLDETIYMEQRDGFVSKEYTNKECLLRKALYALR
jgi:Reverse transcriptase (RNA-dependent DNA polymerase)